MNSFETFPPDPPAPRSGPNVAVIALAVALALSIIGNALLLRRGPTVVQAPPPECPTCEVCAPPVECEVCEICEICNVCPEPVEHATSSGGTGGGTRPPRVDEAAAAEGEAHLAHAETTGERDPVQVAAQRRVADGVDRIVTSHSAAAARRFFQRNLPSFASMDCAFRDPASAEHVRMQLRPMNELLPADERLSEEELHRFERDLRCPRE